MADNVLQFPAQLRVVPDTEPDTFFRKAPVVVVHDGKTYDLAALVRRLTPGQMQALEQSAPRSGQALWDEVVHRWPALADEIAAATGQGE